METKYVRVPFEVELAKKITDKSVEGRIVRNYDNANVRIVCFDQKYEGDYILGCLVSQKCGEGYSAYKQNGKNLSDDKSDYDLMLEVPEYLAFKDGDVIAFGDKYTFIGVFKSIWLYNESHSDYVVLNHVDRLMFDGDAWTYKNARFATEPERQKLIEALKASKEPKAKECLRMLGIEVKPECEFKPFDKVLVRDNYKDSKWGCDLFSHKNEDGLYVCIGQIWENCIPYEGNEHLLGTTENYE